MRKKPLSSDFQILFLIHSSVTFAGLDGHMTHREPDHPGLNEAFSSRKSDPCQELAPEHVR